MTYDAANEHGAGKGEEGGEEGTTYLITEDLSIIIREWCGNQDPPLKPPTKRFFGRIFADLRNSLQKRCFPDGRVKVEALPSDTFADFLDRPRSLEAKANNEFWVSLERVYSNIGKEGRDGYYLSLTRFVTKDWGKWKERGTRPEDLTCGSLETQVNACFDAWKRSSGGEERPVVLVDDGTFDGDTVCEVLRRLAEKGMPVKSVRIGVAKLNGLLKIAGWTYQRRDQGTAESYSVSFLGCLKLCPPIVDWVCERDFFPGVPLSGKVVCEETAVGLEPKRLYPGAPAWRMPYLYEWGDIMGWATLRHGFREFTYDALGLSIRLWSHLQDNRKHEILVKDLPSLPYKVYRSDAGEMRKMLERPWVEVLSEARKALPV